MHSTNRRMAWLALALVASWGLPALAQEAAAPAMTPEQQAMMDAMMKAGTPGAEHAWLASLAGSWTFKASSWMGPEGPATEFSGSVERTMILGGRVMLEKVSSVVDGMPFEGMGMNGYDNVTKTHWGSWNDNMSTGMMSMTGTCREGKCEHASVAADPMTGKPATGRMTSEHRADHEHHVMYAKGPDGKEFKAMEFHYTRKK